MLLHMSLFQFYNLLWVFPFKFLHLFSNFSNQLFVLVDVKQFFQFGKLISVNPTDHFDVPVLEIIIAHAR